MRIVNLYKLLTEQRNEFVMSKQTLRSSTTIGTNVRKAINAESLYWIERLKATNYITQLEFDSIHRDAIGILKMICSIIISSKA